MPKGTGKTDNYGSRSISIVEQARATETKDFNLEKIIQWIKTGSGRFAKNIVAVREATEAGDLDRASDLKRNLPAVMFSGSFSRRSSKSLGRHSGMICMDVDKIDTPEKKVDEMRFDPYIIAAFVSPSGNGLKAIFAIPDDEDRHKESFEAAKRYLSTYGLQADESGKDVSRLCFLSYDPDIHYAPDAVELPFMPVEILRSTEIKTIGGDRIGDKYNSSPSAKSRAISSLTKAGWTIGRSGGDRTYCTRSGKSGGVSGEIRNDGSFFCYSDNASPLEPGANYSPFALTTYLDFGGDFKESTKFLSAEFGDHDSSISSRDYFNKNVAEVQHSENVGEMQHSESSEEPEGRKKREIPLWQDVEIPDDLDKQIRMEYPILIEGLVHRGTKMVLGGGSKSYKTWTLINLAISVAGGHKWLGKQCTATNEDVIFLNFEVPHKFFLQRIRSICKAREIDVPKNFKVWSLRGISNDLTEILQRMQGNLNNGLSLMCIDPIYKALGDKDENSAGDIGLLMNEVEAIVEQTGAAVAFGAHYSKGNQADKDPLDRISGSGVFARDPDTIMGLTAHEENNCFTVHAALRNFPNVEPFVVEWEFPLFSDRPDLNPNSLKKPNQKASRVSVQNLIENAGTVGIRPFQLKEEAKRSLNIGDRTVERYAKELIAAGIITKQGGIYAMTVR